MKVAANLTMMFQEAGALLNRYAAASKAGFRFVECAFPYSETTADLKNCLKTHNLTQVLINAPVDDFDKGGRGLACLPNSREDFQASVQKAATYAKEMQCHKIHVMAGVPPPGIAYSQCEDAYIDNIKYAAKLFAKDNIQCLVEPINPFSIPNYFLNSYDQAIAYLQKIQEPNLKLQLDIFHVQQICGNLSRTIRKCMPYVGHIQVAQVPDRHEPSSSGEIQYEYVFHFLKELGYQEYIGLEYSPKGTTVEGLAWIDQYSLIK